jgi:hypothetical protein
MVAKQLSQHPRGAGLEIQEEMQELALIGMVLEVEERAVLALGATPLATVTAALGYNGLTATSTLAAAAVGAVQAVPQHLVRAALAVAVLVVPQVLAGLMVQLTLAVAEAQQGRPHLQALLELTVVLELLLLDT